MANPSIHYFSTLIEHTLVFLRSNGEQVNLAIHHFGTTREVSLVVFENTYQDSVKEQITLSYHEARLLRDLLNRPEIQQFLEREE